MRGEHKVGENLTWVKGNGQDETSRKILAGGRRAVGQNGDPTRSGVEACETPPHNPTVTQNADGTLNYGEANGTSIFDPVLCELAYRWFCAPGGVILDPFAGGSVRGIVASKLGRQYLGIDLSERQIEANRGQAQRICGEPQPEWIVGNSVDAATIAAGRTFDFLFSCPPYGDLERYSDDPADLSTMEYADFRATYARIIAACAGLLKPDRFACFVVGDIRDGKGYYRRFVSDTEQAFEDAGMRLYNEAILVTAVGSLPIRAGRQFESGRKLGKTHQNVLVFCNGDPKKATEAVGAVEFGEVPNDERTAAV